MGTIDSLVKDAQPFLRQQVLDVAGMLSHLYHLEGGADYNPPASWAICHLAESMGLVSDGRECHQITPRGRSVYEALLKEGFYADTKLGGKGSAFPALRL